MNSKPKIIYQQKSFSNTSDLLVFSPHPDDAELFCGGLIAKSTTTGVVVDLVDLSLGEMASRGTVMERLEEAKKSSQILGLNQRLNLELVDSQIGLHYESEMLKIVAVLRRLKPKVVVIPFGDNRHPDHKRARHLIEEAVFFANLPKKYPELGEAHLVSSSIYYMMRETFSPSFVTNISEVNDIKFSAIKCFQSQVSRSEAGHETLVSDPLSLLSVEARDAYFGGFIGVKYAEPFYTNSCVSIDDPFSHFRDKATNKSFLFKSNN